MTDWLKVFASFQSKRSLQELQLLMSGQTAMEEDTLVVNGARLSLAIMACGADEFLVRGEAADIKSLESDLLAALKQEMEVLQMDIFEEDGRLLKRITTA